MDAPQKSTWDLYGQIITVWIVVVVVGVLAAAVLAPVFVRTGGHGRKDNCQYNLKECAIALMMYWNDYDGHLPSSALVNNSKGWSKRDFESFATGRGTLPPRGRPRTWAQVLYYHMNSRDRVSCPADPLATGGSGAVVSYAWKAATDKAWYGVGCTKPCRKESDFLYRADQIILYERAGFHSGAAEGLKNGVQINVAYLDTHVRSVTITNGGNRWITSPSVPGEPAYFNFDNTKPKSASNPPAEKVRPAFTDPSRYSDWLP